jgi:hypothetical protein
MRRTVLLLAILITITAAAARAGEIPRTPIPKGNAPKIDGVLSEGEWKDAKRVALAPEGEGWLMRDDKMLYVAVRTGRNCIPSLALLKDGKIVIIHASASLGTAVYERSGDVWAASRTFKWRCRNGRTTGPGCDEFLADEGWFGTTCEMGKRGEAEFRIARRLLTDGETRFALVVCRLMPMPMIACVWPATVNDGSTEQDLLFGRCPKLTFEPDTWARLELAKPVSPAVRFLKGLDAIEKALDKDPRKAYVDLLDLVAAHVDVKEHHDRAKNLRVKLEKRKEVRPEATAQRRLESVLRWVKKNGERRKIMEKKFREIETKYPETRAARVAREMREKLGGDDG